MAEIENQRSGTERLEDRIKVGGTELVLNGAGIRTKIFFKVYVGALYVVQPTHEANAVIMAARAHWFEEEPEAGSEPEEAADADSATGGPDATEKFLRDILPN